MFDAPLIYNLFPRLAGDFRRWSEHTDRAKRMNFNWVFINPIQYPGFSGSLYAIKDFYRLNPIVVPDDACDDPMEALRDAFSAIHDRGLRVMMDLVINHTSKDSPLIKAHPSWFRRDQDGYLVSPSAIDPADAREVTVWGDLAEVDNTQAEDRGGLWAYWTAMVQFYLDLGVDGFRCDAAYKVPTALWEQLIRAGRRRKAETVFIAETLGCRLREVRSLASAGFDYLFNSSKWWSFDEPWCLQQHESFGAIAPSISFPESHDTERLMAETDGRVQVQKQRYLLAAFFSEGLLMPIGYEFGFRQRLDVVKTTPDDWEDTGVDLCGIISDVNRLKLGCSTLCREGHMELRSGLDRSTLVLLKRGEADDPDVWILINKDWHQPQTLDLRALRVGSPSRGTLHRVDGDRLTSRPAGDDVLELQPAEVALIIAGGSPPRLSD